ncbi:hypothetical protein GKR56_13170 [Providencia alcalifaciens]|jgi:hypothetical protein|uniref:Uncharacterized protein n=2 Tax=Providencia alcalifaciens TaxID=126385 RepID=A0A291ED76_9GAMM|nr:MULTISPECIES: hypothetical protein [Providencia]MTC76302.1 hypothetical protein [Providencia sp. wls1919]ATG17081.1 hypothetical protein CO695_12535 [Providencia alcalifaciens]EEB44012.1 hypothetical protein PROVALCAL_03889 [Providencia alcalifaciens DSM 30120]EKT66837.1 hypothetical protein OO9_03258 [Providencia alcalifaciens Dmel2]MDR2242633.1 hypothetical protein [Providencia alcalifaciens]
MAYFFALAAGPSGRRCRIDDYGANTGFAQTLFHFSSFFSAYRQMQSLPSNCRLSRSTQSKVMGGLYHAK